ncbi:MAG: monovalent cation:proton antiporter-2 (CPA2) family protein [Nitrospirales bacterium]
MEHPDILLAFVVLLLIAVIVLPFFKRLGLGSVLGFLTAGAIVGPWGLELVARVETIRHFSEFGVVFLLFVIGLELSPSKLWVMRRAVFGLGTLQIVVTGLCIAVYAWFFGISWNIALVAGFGLALSSTAIGLQILTERGEMTSPYGQSSFAILIMQDIAVVPLLALVPLFGVKLAAEGEPFGLAALKVLAVLGGVIVFVRFLLQPALRYMATSRTHEGFVGAVLLTVLGSAWLMEQVHLSPALGAFLTGLLLSDSEYRHQIEAVVEPFRGYLLGLFFISIGMSIDFGLLTEKGLIILGHVGGLLLIKALVLYGLCRAFRYSTISSIRVALLLPQCGEFGFVLFGVALASGVMDEVLFQHFLLLIAATMAVTPLLIPVSSFLTARLGKPKEEAREAESPPDDIHNHVLLAGFGRGGEMLASMLQNSQVPYTALDNDPEKVARGRARGFQVYYGDASQPNVLQATMAGKAKLAVVTLNHPESVEKAVAAIRYLYPGLPILARAKDLAHSEALKKAGATKTVLEFIETSLVAGRTMLLESGVAQDQVNELIHNYRRDDYAFPKKIMSGDTKVEPG